MASEILKRCGFSSPLEVRLLFNRAARGRIFTDEQRRKIDALVNDVAGRNERKYAKIPLYADKFFKPHNLDKAHLRYIVL